MGEPTTVHPDHLWIWDRAVYLDERQRTWLPTIIKVERGFRVLMRQQDVPLSHAMRPSQLGAHRLPLLWQLYPGNRYKGSDSSFWSIVYHVKFTTSEDMLLDQMPESDREANEEAAEAGPRLRPANGRREEGHPYPGSP